VQVLQADERQRWGGLPLDQQLSDHQQGVPEEALSSSLSAADKKMVTSTMKKMVGPEAE
jgi:hypothetical protein